MRIALVSKDQFGYHTDMFMYAKYLSKNHDVQFICLDKGLDRYSLRQVNVHYSSSESKLKRWQSLLTSTWNRRSSADVFFVKYFPGCSVLLLFMKKSKIIMDIRTLSVEKKVWKRRLADLLLNLEACFFSNITIVSPQLAKKVWVKHLQIVSLGAEVKRLAKDLVRIHAMSKVNLLYVGTLHNRSIEDLIHGLALFSSRNNRNPYLLKIVGSGYSNEEKSLSELAERLGLSSRVTLTGRLKDSALQDAFDDADVGVVHVPNTPYFANQPSTKLYEYWSNGLPVLGSDYPMNRAEITDGTGLIYADSPEGFASALERLMDRRLSLSGEEINLKAFASEWKNIVKLELLPALMLASGLENQAE